MNRIRLKVLGLSYSMSQSGAYALILSDESDVKRIPIVIGMPEAQSIAIQLEHIYPQRPLTHDLIKLLADTVGMVLKEVFIYRLDSGIFYSELLFEHEENVIKLDSRTSDAIALALRYNCPIYTTLEIFEKAGIGVQQEEEKINTSTVPEEHEKDISEYSVLELTQMLHDAVEKEDYEKASEIRDVLNKKNRH